MIQYNKRKAGLYMYLRHKTWKKLTAWVTAAAMLAAPTGISENVEAMEIPLVANAASVKYMPAGSSFQLTANTDIQKITFSSSKKSVAMVDQKGLIIAKKSGTTKIKARSGRKVTSITLKVKKTVGFTITKKAGTYDGTVTTKVKAQKGYTVYYTTGDKFKSASKIKAGKNRLFKFSGTTTLKLYPVRKNVKMTTAKLNKTAGKNKNRADYYYQITQKITDGKDISVPTGTAAAVPASSVPAASGTANPSQAPGISPSNAPVQTSDMPSGLPEETKQPEASIIPAPTDIPQTAESPKAQETGMPGSATPAVTEEPEASPDISAAPAESLNPQETPEVTKGPEVQPGEEGYTGDTVEGYVPAYAGAFDSIDGNVSEENAVSIVIPKSAAKQEIKDSAGNTVASLSKKNKLSINMPGTYVISSEGSGDGETVAATVEAEYGPEAAGCESKELHLILDGVKLTSAPSKTDNGIITIKNGDVEISRAVITIKGNNSLCDQGSAELNADDHTAGIMSKKNVPLTINGSGSLDITSENGNGIQCKNLLKIQDAHISVKTGRDTDAGAGNNGISGKTGLYLKNADIEVESAGDALKTTLDAADVAADPSLAGQGNISICGGNYNLHSHNKDGISAFGTLYLSPDQMEVAADNRLAKEITADSGSCKAVKAGNTIYIPATAGAITADTSATKGTSAAGEETSTADDAVYCEGYICINSSEALTIQPGKAAVRAGKGILINGGLLTEKKVDDFSTYIKQE